MIKFDPTIQLAAIVTAGIAIVLFLIKEIVEEYKRWRADARKLRGIRKMLAREAGHNRKIYGQVERALEFIKEHFNSQISFLYEVETDIDGKGIFQIRNPDGTTRYGATLSAPHTKVMNDVMREVAELDSNLFEILERAYGSVVSPENIREQILKYINQYDGDPVKSFTQDFYRNGTESLQRAIRELERLQQACKDPAKMKDRLFKK